MYKEFFDKIERAVIIKNKYKHAEKIYDIVRKMQENSDELVICAYDEDDVLIGSCKVEKNLAKDIIERLVEEADFERCTVEEAIKFMQGEM